MQSDIAPAAEESGAARIGWGPARRLPRVARRYERIDTFSRRILRDPMTPLALLGVIVVISLFARIYDIGQPCSKPCQTPAQHTLIFDESYYVNAARVIAGINPPSGAPYNGAPLGDDPNAEHPQLAKAIIAGSIELFGDNPDGWRLPSVLFGLIALVALYALVRGAGGSQWLALGATAVMATDNLLLVHGRIATLDIFAVAMMLIAGAFYVRGSPIRAGIALGIAGCMKETGLYLLAAIVILEGLHIARAWWRGEGRGWVREHLLPGLVAIGATVAVFFALLWLLDVIVPAYDTGTKIKYAGSPFTHFAHMVHYATLLHATPYATGIASTPLEWLLDQRTINYAKVAVNSMSGGKIIASHATISYQGSINPFIIFMLIPAFFAAAWAWWRSNERIALVGVAWCLGTFLPSVVASEIQGRVAYLYYMVIVMPGIYLVVTRLFARRAMPVAARWGWALALVFSLINLYPIQTLF